MAALLPNATLLRGESIASSMIKKRVKSDTLGIYKSKIKKMIEWFREHIPSALTGPAGAEELIIPPNKDHILQFFGAISVRDEEFFDVDVNDETEMEANDSDKPLKAVSTMGGYRSALVHAHKAKSLKLSPELDIDLQSFMQGLKRSVADLKQRGIMSIWEGKQPISKEGYRKLAQLIMKIEPDQRNGSWAQMTFAWAFLLLSWNLIARSIMIGNIHLCNMSWQGDCLQIRYGAHKSDQEGSTSNYGRNIYANPTDPTICPILALSIIVFTKGYRNKDASTVLFEGKDPESRWADVLKMILKNMTASDKLLLGTTIDNIGTHSLRKGAASYLASIDGLSVIMIFLRACWSLGGVQDRYIFQGQGGDQIIGRAATGISISDPNFTTLPPHFDDDTLQSIAQQDWELIIPGYMNYPQSFQQCIPFLLASVIYHQDFLRGNLSTRHPIFGTRIFTGGYALALKHKVYTGLNMCDHTKLQASGVPRELVTACTVRSLCKIIEEDRAAFKRRQDEMDDKITALFSELPRQVREDILNNLSINGAVPITPDQFQLMLNQMTQQITHNVLTTIQPATSRQAENTDQQATYSSQSQYDTFIWGGKFHMVPSDYRLNTGTVKQLWDLWYFGDKHRKIKPLKHLRAIDLNVKVDQTNLSRLRKVMDKLETVARSHHKIAVNESISNMSKSMSDAICDYSLEKLVDTLYSSKRPRRYEDLQYNTLYDKFVKH